MAKKIKCDINLKKNQQEQTEKTNSSPFINRILIILIFLLLASIGYVYANNEKLERSPVKEEQSLGIKTTPTVLQPTPTIVKAKVSPVPTSSNRPKITPTKQPLPILNGSNIFNMINSYRASNGKPFLSVSDELCRLAGLRADYMMANNMAAAKSNKAGEHSGFDDFINQYSGNGLGENLALNLATDASVIEVWKNSPPHKELMLWTERDGIQITKGCISTRVSEVGSVVVLLIGDK